jgi:hypothetical protein
MGNTRKTGDLVNQTITLSAPLVGSANLTDPLNFSITKANTTTDGYVSKEDWNFFKNKQDALGFTPYNATNPDGFITSSALTPYLTSSTAASTYYPLTNPSGYITGITSGMVTTALGFTPYNATNPSGYITSSALTSYVPYTGATSNVDLGTYTIKVGSGTVTANSIQVGASNVGLFSSSANRLDFVTNGVSRMSINSSGTVVMGSSSTNIIGNTFLDFDTNTTGLRFTSTSLNLSASSINCFNIIGPSTTGNTTSFNVTKPNNTGQTATFSISGWNYNGGSREWLSGNIGTQNENVWGATTYSFVGASTITNAYGNVFNAPIAGTNATITNRFAALFNQQISLTQTVTTETVVQTRTVTIVINGTTYKLLVA